jgi:hypothetical protein
MTDKPKKPPTHIAYQVREGKKDSFWTKIGAAWAHNDGNGFSIQLDSVPTDGKITLRKKSDKKASQGNASEEAPSEA